MQATAQRPTGITILAVLAIIGGVFGVLGAVALMGLGAVGAGGLAVAIGGGLLVQAILNLAFGFGAWTLKPWAWTLGIVSQVISLLLAVLAIVNGTAIGSEIVPIVIAGAILYYLFTPGVKRAFGKA
ncbi:MAG: hypothetical protein M3014_00555 [Chloroflexota bacterium]|nr:hypothetical protein [Chloroflexota bacterium]